MGPRRGWPALPEPRRLVASGQVTRDAASGHAEADVAERRVKVEVARRVIRMVQPDADVHAIPSTLEEPESREAITGLWSGPRAFASPTRS